MDWIEATGAFGPIIAALAAVHAVAAVVAVYARVRRRIAIAFLVAAALPAVVGVVGYVDVLVNLRRVFERLRAPTVDDVERETLRGVSCLRLGMAASAAAFLAAAVVYVRSRQSERPQPAD